MGIQKTRYSEVEEDEKQKKKIEERDKGQNPFPKWKRRCRKKTRESPQLFEEKYPNKLLGPKRWPQHFQQLNMKIDEDDLPKRRESTNEQ